MTVIKCDICGDEIPAKPNADYGFNLIIKGYGSVHHKCDTDICGKCTGTLLEILQDPDPYELNILKGE